LRGMVRKIQVPEEISRPIRDAEIANQELLRNQQEKLRADGAAEKMEAETKINQRKQQIEAETAKKVAETQAQQRLAVAEIALQTARKSRGHPHPRQSGSGCDLLQEGSRGQRHQGHDRSLRRR